MSDHAHDSLCRNRAACDITHISYIACSEKYNSTVTGRMKSELVVDGVDPKYKDTFDGVAVGLTHVDLNGKFIRVNNYLCDFLGYSQEEILSLTFQALSRPVDLPESLAWIKGSLAGEIYSSFSKVKQYKHKDGHWCWAKLTTTLIRNSLGQPDYFISSIQDITELKKTEEALDESLAKLNRAYQELERLSRQDHLTGVYNIKAFREYLSDAFKRFQRDKTVATLVFIDVDKFKGVNDEHGHRVGDMMLQKIASTLLENSRDTDVVGRYGGDEFAVLLSNSGAEEAEQYCQRVGDIIEISLEDGSACQTGISFGVCEITPQFCCMDEWLEQADKLMYQNKLCE